MSAKILFSSSLDQLQIYKSPHSKFKDLQKINLIQSLNQESRENNLLKQNAHIL